MLQPLPEPDLFYPEQIKNHTKGEYDYEKPKRMLQSLPEPDLFYPEQISPARL